MEAPNPNKLSASSSTCQNQNPTPYSLPNVHGFNKNDADLFVSSFLSLMDLSSLSSSFSIGYFLDRALEKLFEAYGEDESGKDHLTDHYLELASFIQDSAKRCYRKRASLHNSNSWSLSRDLTVKVFSMLDTKSLMQVAACCSMLNKYAMDPLCYSHIDLTNGCVDNEVVHNMILHAGNELRSLKVGCIPCLNESTTSLLTGTCLAPLSSNHGYSGMRLRSLHIYHHRSLEPQSLYSALLACLNLTDLKIVGWSIDPIDNILELVPRKCQHLYIESEMRFARSSIINVTPFAINCSNITSLSLIGFTLKDSEAYFLIESFCKLKYFNLSKTSGFTGSFLRTVKLRCKDTMLETLILRNCFSLEETPISMFLDSLLKGNFKFIQHIDVSNIIGLRSIDRRYCKPKLCLDKLKEERPRLTILADFTSPTFHNHHHH